MFDFFCGGARQGVIVKVVMAVVVMVMTLVVVVVLVLVLVVMVMVVGGDDACNNGSTCRAINVYTCTFTCFPFVRFCHFVFVNRVGAVSI